MRKCVTQKRTVMEKMRNRWKSGRTPISVITLSVSGLDTPIKRQRLAE